MIARLIHNEVLKLRTTRSPWLLLGAGQLLVLAGVAGYLSGNDLNDPATAPAGLTHLGVASLFPLVLGIMAVAGEYQNKTIIETYLTTPRRTPVIAAKLAVYSAAGLLFGVLGGALGLATTAIWFRVEGADLDWSGAALWQAVGGCVGWNVAFAAIGVGVGSLIRSRSAAITVALAWIAVIEGIVGQLIGDLNRWLPFAAGAAFGRVSSGILTGLPQAGAGLLLLGYAGAIVAAALVVTARRDVA